MKMRLSFVSTVVLLALASSQPGFAKDSHAQRGARPSATNAGASGKRASGTNPSGANPAGATSTLGKANVSIDPDSPVAPPVLPPHGVTQPPVRIVSPIAKNVNPANGSRSPVGGVTTTAAAPRNAIGQPIAPLKDFAGAQLAVLPARGARAPASAPTVHGGPVIAPLPSSPARISATSNRGNVNGATIRQTGAPAVIGGPAQPRYGINGTTVQNKH